MLKNVVEVEAVDGHRLRLRFEDVMSGPKGDAVL
jgi:hypothetical protein